MAITVPTAEDDLSSPSTIADDSTVIVVTFSEPTTNNSGFLIKINGVEHDLIVLNPRATDELTSSLSLFYPGAIDSTDTIELIYRDGDIYSIDFLQQNATYSISNTSTLKRKLVSIMESKISQGGIITLYFDDKIILENDTGIAVTVNGTTVTISSIVDYGTYLNIIISDTIYKNDDVVLTLTNAKIYSNKYRSYIDDAIINVTNNSPIEKEIPLVLDCIIQGTLLKLFTSCLSNVIDTHGITCTDTVGSVTLTHIATVTPSTTHDLVANRNISGTATIVFDSDNGLISLSGTPASPTTITV